jgi:hypothetical protein
MSDGVSDPTGGEPLQVKYATGIERLQASDLPIQTSIQAPPLLSNGREWRYKHDGMDLVMTKSIIGIVQKSAFYPKKYVPAGRE